MAEEAGLGVGGAPRHRDQAQDSDTKKFGSHGCDPMTRLESSVAGRPPDGPAPSSISSESSRQFIDTDQIDSSFSLKCRTRKTHNG